MECVYILTHLVEFPHGEENVEYIGIYSTYEKAECALKRASALPVFLDHPGGFYIGCYKLNEDEWREGYFTYIPSDE